MDKNCIICTKENSSYKCPQCFSRYCSLACCKSHKLICTQALSSNSNSKAPIVTTFSSPQPTIEATIVKNEIEDTSASQLLTPLQLEILSKSSYINDMLKSPLLCKHILEVDKASDRQGELRKKRKVNKDFDEFIMTMMKEVSTTEK